jgi:WD40 repeat protein
MGSILHIPDVESSFQKKIPRRIFVKCLAGATLMMSGIGCAPFGSSSPPLGKLLVTYRGHPWYRTGRIWAIAWSPDSTHIASSAKDVQVWNATDGSHILTYHTGYPAESLGWSPDGTRIAFANTTPTVPIWDATTGKNVLVYQELSEDVQHDVADVSAVAWSPDGKRIVTGGDFDHTVIESDRSKSETFYDEMRVWDSTSGKLIYKSPTDSLFGVLWSPDGTKIAALGSNIEVLDASNASHIATLAGGEPAAWSPDSRYIASPGRMSTVNIWDANSGNTVSTFTTLDHLVWSLAWSPDGKHIALAYGIDSKDVQILDAQTGKLTYTYHSQCFVTRLAWSPDGTRIASGGLDDDKRILLVEVWQAS